MTPTERDRLATVETKVGIIDNTLRTEVVPLLKNVKAFQDRQVGFAAGGALIISGLAALGAALISWFKN